MTTTTAAGPARRMSLANAKTSRCIQPYRTLAYGAEKVGKTFTLAKAPGVIALDIERRMGHVSVMKMPDILSWQDALDALEELRVAKHSYQNVLIDSVSALEKLLKVAVMKASGWTAEDADEYQRWTKVGNSSYWPEFFAACERLERERNMGILMTAHMQVKSMKNPSGDPYDRFRPALCGDAGPQMFLHWVHDVLFFAYDDAIRVEKKGGKERVRTSTTGKRVIYTQHCPAWDAGNSCGLPKAIVADWGTYADLRLQGLGDLPSLQALIEVLLLQVNDAAVRERATAHYQANKASDSDCRQILGRLREIIEEQQEPAPEVPVPAAS